MSKRFTDSEKWSDPWFGDLEPLDKLFWIYLLDNCDHSGIWKVHLKLAEFHLGFKPDLSRFGERIRWISDQKIFIPGFIDFQYGTLNEANRVHKSVLDRLEKQGAYKALTRPLQRAKDKEKDKDKAKEKEKDKDKEKDKEKDKHQRIDVEEYKETIKQKRKRQNGSLYTEEFEQFWFHYPRKVGKKKAFDAWNRAERPGLDQILKVLATSSETWVWRKDNGSFIPHPSTWINRNGWEDEFTTGDFKGPESRLDRLNREDREMYQRISGQEMSSGFAGSTADARIESVIDAEFLTKLKGMTANGGKKQGGAGAVDAPRLVSKCN